LVVFGAGKAFFATVFHSVWQCGGQDGRCIRRQDGMRAPSGALLPAGMQGENMPKFRCELFGRFVFAEELSYAELLEKEAQLKGTLSAFLAGAGFVHLHFTSTGDFLLMQGMTAEHDHDVFQEVCEAASRILDEGVAGRLLFVDRLLDAVHFSVLRKGTWQASSLDWPLPEDTQEENSG
jgi:hypothetical protein